MKSELVVTDLEKTPVPENPTLWLAVIVEPDWTAKVHLGTDGSPPGMLFLAVSAAMNALRELIEGERKES